MFRNILSMETLIDNRIFPQEMQEKPKETSNQNKKPKQKKDSNILYIILLLLVILGLVYYIMIYKKDSPVIEESLTYEQEQTLVVEKLQDGVSELTDEERLERVNAFFASQQ